MADNREFGRLEGLFEAQKEYIGREFQYIRQDIQQVKLVLEKHGKDIEALKMNQVRDRRKEIRAASVIGGASGLLGGVTAAITWLKFWK